MEVKSVLPVSRVPVLPSLLSPTITCSEDDHQWLLRLRGSEVRDGMVVSPAQSLHQRQEARGHMTPAAGQPRLPPVLSRCVSISGASCLPSDQFQHGINDHRHGNSQTTFDEMKPPNLSCCSAW